MAANDEDESTAVIVGVFAGILLAITAVVVGAGVGKPAQAAMPLSEVVSTEIAPVGVPLIKVYFDIGQSTLEGGNHELVNGTRYALAGYPERIVLLSGFHDPSGNPDRNAELAKQRAVAVRDVLVAAGIPLERIKFRKPESTLGSGGPEEGRRVEVRVQ